MKYLRMLAIIGSLWAAALPVAFAQQPAAAPKSGAAEQVTVITSDRLTFDYQNQYAVFEKNVMVTDPDMQLASDKLTVQFDESGKAQTIKAEGRVTITQADKTSQSAVATYDVATGKIVLAGKPRVTRGRDVLEGDVITFWRNENRMVCQPQARLVIYPEEGASMDLFPGE
jgi:lipopolysaccharide export system protein LptA